MEESLGKFNDLLKSSEIFLKPSKAKAFFKSLYFILFCSLKCSYCELTTLLLGEIGESHLIYFIVFCIKIQGF